MQWRRWLIGNWQLKLFGLAVAVVLWTYVRSEQMLHLTLTVPLELRNPPRTMQFARRPPGSVEVRLVAQRDLIPHLKPRSVRAVVDLSKVRGRRLSITLTPRHIIRPDGVGVLNIDPSQLVFEFVPVDPAQPGAK